jgi:hypothetical protein
MGSSYGFRNSVHVHGVAEASDDALGAETAGLLLVRVTAFGEQHLLVMDGHAAAAYPVVAVAGVNMVEVCQRVVLLRGMTSSE